MHNPKLHRRLLRLYSYLWNSRTINFFYKKNDLDAAIWSLEHNQLAYVELSILQAHSVQLDILVPTARYFSI